MRYKTGLEIHQQIQGEITLAEKELDKILIENEWVFKALWHFGDGNGGEVLAIIKKTFSPEPLTPTRKIKKGIPRHLSKQVFERDKYRCKHCDSHLDLSVDHIHPEVKGGETTLDNLQTLCLSCNSKKGVKTNAN